MNDSSTPNALARIKHWHAYQESRTETWATRTQFDWFRRRHCARLVKAGALLVLRGAWHVDPVLFDAEVIDIAREDAANWLGRESGKVAA